MRTMTLQEVLLAPTAVLVPTGAAAQQVGLTGGLNASTLVFHPAQDRLRGPEHRTGLLAGAFVSAPLQSRAELRVEFLVSQKGVREVFRLGDELSLTDVEVPVLIQFNLHGQHASGVCLFVGPTLSITTSAVYHDEGESEHVESDLDGQTDVGL